MSCTKSLDCPARYSCYAHKCICNPIMMFHGENCEQSNVFVSVISILVLAFSAVLFVCSLLVLLKMIKSAKNLFAASVTTSFFIFLSVGSIVPHIIANILRSFNIGDQDMERSYLLSIPLSIFGTLTISTSLNVCLLWVELSGGGLAAQNNVVWTRKCILFCSAGYTSVVLVLFIVGQNYPAIAILNTGAMFMITVLFLMGSRMLSKRLSGNQRISHRQPGRRLRVLPARKIHKCSRMVSTNSFGFSVSSIMYAIFASHENLGILAFLCSLFALLHILFLHLSILRYLGLSKVLRIVFSNKKSIQVKHTRDVKVAPAPLRMPAKRIRFTITETKSIVFAKIRPTEIHGKEIKHDEQEGIPSPHGQSPSFK